MSDCKYGCKSKSQKVKGQFFLNNKIICPDCDELLLDIEIESELAEEQNLGNTGLGESQERPWFGMN